MRRGAAALIGLLVGCAPAKAELCQRLDDKLESCDLPSVRALCEQLTPDEEDRISDYVDQLRCDGPRLERTEALTQGLCKLMRWPCPGQLFAAPDPVPTKYPLVFVSGIDGSAVFDWNPRVLQAAAAIGPNDVELVEVTPWATPQTRAQDLWRALQTIDAPKVNLICYAVAGLDCRYLVSPGGLFRSDPASRDAVQAKVATITTIATPHRGTAVAEVALDLSSEDPKEIAARLLGTDAVPTSVAPLELEGVRETLQGLTPDASLAFNASVIDAAAVYYQSFAGFSHIFGQPFYPSEEDLQRDCLDEEGRLRLARHADTYDVMSPLLWLPAALATRTTTPDGTSVYSPSDGLVSIVSAKWGRFRGCIPADHYDVIGQIDDLGPDPNSGFDAARFYQTLAVDLAESGY